MSFKRAASLLLIFSTPCAEAKTVAYLFAGSNHGVQIAQTKDGALASGFLFDTNCTNEQQVIWIRVKAGSAVEWSYTQPDPNSASAEDAYVIDETARSWSLYYEDTDYGIPIELINSGSLTKAKLCS